MKVFILDDDAAHRMLAKRALRQEFPQAEVIEADSVAAAHAAFSPLLTSDGIAIIDINLKNERGLSLLPLLKTNNSIPIIVVSTSDLEADVQESYTAGAHCFVVKDSDPAKYQVDLLAAAKFLLSK